MIPVAIPARSGPCFACYDWAEGPAVLVVPPFGLEAEAGARIWRDFAVRLAASGIAVLRLDLPGTGDSAGTPAQPGQVASWRDAIRAAHAWLAERHAGRVALLGCRFGALLAMDAAPALDVARLVLLDPPASGSAFARMLKARARLEGHGAPPEGADFIQAYGVPVSAETLDGLALLPSGFDGPPPPTLVALPSGASAWPDRLRQQGATVSVVPFEGHADFVLQGPMHAKPPLAVFDAVADFLRAMGPAAALPPPPAASLVLPGLTEIPVSFGDGLFGLVCRPDEPLRGAPAVVLPSIGNRPRSGLDRSWTRLARHLALQGVTSLRFDTGGVGDSDGTPDHAPVVHAYLPQRIADTKAAIDLLASRGAREIVMVGHCSAAYAAWQATIADDRVVGLMAVNMLVLGRQTEAAAARLLRPPAEPEPSAEDAPPPPPPGVGKALARVLRDRCPAPVRHLAQSMGAEERDARRSLTRVAGRGCAVALVYSDAPGEEYRFRRAFGPSPRLPEGVRLTRIENADHEVSGRRQRAQLLAMAASFVMSFTESRLAPADRTPLQEIAA